LSTLIQVKAYRPFADHDDEGAPEIVSQTKESSIPSITTTGAIDLKRLDWLLPRKLPIGQEKS
jgi:hypothetical protein